MNEKTAKTVTQNNNRRFCISIGDKGNLNLPRCRRRLNSKPEKSHSQVDEPLWREIIIFSGKNPKEAYDKSRFTVFAIKTNSYRKYRQRNRFACSIKRLPFRNWK